MVSSLKMYLAAQAYGQAAVDQADAGDRFALTLDKLALLAVLPMLFTQQELLPKILSEATPTITLESFNKVVVDSFFKQVGVPDVSAITAKELWNNDRPLVFPLESPGWRQLFAKAVSSVGTYQILMPLDYLDRQLRSSLQETFDLLKSTLSSSQRVPLTALAKMDGLEAPTYELFYGIIDRIRTIWEAPGAGKALNFYNG